MATGTCVNKTGEDLLVYGPRNDQTEFDNSLYRLPNGMKTPAGWDCDGIYVPSGRIVVQRIGAKVQGPVAVKFGIQVLDIEFTISRLGADYEIPLNQGVFKPTETCRPSKYPECVNWDIPIIPQGLVSAYPEVPGAVPV
jgi:hypothetical protein